MTLSVTVQVSHDASAMQLYCGESETNISNSALRFTVINYTTEDIYLFWMEKVYNSSPDLNTLRLRKAGFLHSQKCWVV